MKYPKKESTILEFKRELPSKQQIVKTTLGFCNMHGGILVIGVDDTGEIVGIDENLIEQLMEDLHRSIYASCTPPILPSLHIQRIDNKILLLIEVSEGMIKPYFHSSLGKVDGTFIRVGTETVKANALMIQELEWQSKGRYLDQMPVYAGGPEAINTVAFESFLKTRKAPFSPADTEDLLYHYEVLTKEYNRIYPTVGGVLLFGKEPQRFSPESFIICTHFQGTSGRNVIATRDCTGSLFEQYKDCVAFVVSRLNTQFTIEGTDRRKELLEVPEEAVREIIINAIIHRNYQIPGPVKVAIYDDRIEIFSPGNFPGPIRVDHLSVGITYIRNTIIARVFREAGLVEKLGSGFLTLFSAYEERNLPRPVVVEGGGFVKCILPRPGKGLPGLQEMASLIELFYKKGEVKTEDVMQFLAISKATAQRELRRLLEEGVIAKVGKGRSTRYVKK